MDDLTIGQQVGGPWHPGVSGEPSETSHTQHQPPMSEMQDEHLQSGGWATFTKDRRHVSYRTACMSRAHSRRICTRLVPEECGEGRLSFRHIFPG